ncbi:xanthine dehydrogenase, molybdenum binding subunit apoprotein [Tistlia consotensis]|uniref:Xanthine dehydrogenase, molybdenum binding subunit apoprotein n=1 Tax=Tistlia consotensis USBA 355 TaxID=560819 RepID=A0A1Y6CMH3_9PROT|nr:xanthine dehydrogenase family protein molybdopterin-binding subunit [Tistlia consotensis]SMF77826.1 xanthine dehydrogenase, molybdenum binding subunit apoprotein [Tistlia consotensis USBA 355]SNS20422.1 xanthine dehydrogenase, molybdenum binding subunit apoprotein [Tistlia consotensis]
MADSGIGSRTTRREDKRFLTGKGRYTDDINRHGQAYAYFLRAPVAHARVTGIDTSAAETAPGVVAVFTGKDMEADGVGSLPCGWVVTDKHGQPHKAPPHFPLVRDAVRYVGDHVAMVIAESAAEAKDAAELIQVDYEELPAVVDPMQARSSQQIHEAAPENLCYDWELGDKAAADAAFAKAAHVTKLDLINNRLVPNAMEPRAAIGEWDSGTDEYTIYSTSQNPHLLRLILCAFVLGLPESRVRVIAPDVGGGFGSKIFAYAEETACTWASKKIGGRPVKWTAERGEAFLSDCHGRDHVTHCELALDADGRFLGMKVDTTANMGAYLSSFATSVPSYLYATLLAGQYTTPVVYANVKAVFTNTAPVDAYRGAGRPEATYVVERLVEIAARETGRDPAELRRLNFIKPDQFPYQTPVALMYDIGDYEPSLDKALSMIDYKGFGARKAASEARGKLRGIGLSAYIEACGIAPSAVVGSLGAGVGLWESATVRFNATGTVAVMTGAHSHGQGHETTFAQLVSEKLGIPYENVEIVHGDTGRIPMGMGTYGSRSLAVGGSAIVKACDKIIAKGKKIAAHLMEASEGDVEFANGQFTVAGTDKSKAMAEIAFTAYVPHNYPEGVEPGLDETAFYDPLNFTYPSGVHIAEVEIDPDTGITTIADWVAVDDFGNVINPMIVEGQVHGGIAQGVGQALLEHTVYDRDSGQLLTGSYMDYAMPRADNFPTFRVETTTSACTHNPLGVKGCGEAGAIASPAALMNAITDALGVEIDMPATPEKVWRAAQAKLRVAAE